MTDIALRKICEDIERVKGWAFKTEVYWLRLPIDIDDKGKKHISKFVKEKYNANLFWTSHSEMEIMLERT